MSEDAENAKKQIQETVEKILSGIDSERERGVIERRFGVRGDKETLEQVGEILGITRERVRQIEKSTLIRIKISLDDGANADFNAAEKTVVMALHELGRIARTEDLATKVMGDSSVKSRAAMILLGELSKKMIVTTENDRYFPAIALGEDDSDKKIKSRIDQIVAAIKDNKVPLTLDELFKKLSGYEHPDEVAAMASISKLIANLDGQWGLAKWPTVNPKNIRDKIFVVMSRHGKPMHFSEIAEAIRQQNFKRNHVTQQAIHNELIKDDRFILVGRGIYALGEWGYKKGSIADIIADILRKESPLHREEIVKRVLKERKVREATVLLALQNKPQFKRVAKAQYELDESLIPPKKPRANAAKKA
ncbi:MAG: hypothetical protein LBM73_01460 [Candidatus Nomurabacteria bacterium]|jgi:predicted transcriptional regulator|nr:hypothetical protein [Candidatus Nomurabacteria bacterium]